MSIYWYISSMLVSMFVFVMTVVMMFSSEDSYVFRMFGDTEVVFCIFVSLVLLIVGLVTDIKEDKE